MELSRLNRYPMKDVMSFDTGDTLELTWDADFFSRKGVREFERRLNDAISKAREEHLSKLRALEEEVKAFDEKKGKGKKAAEASPEAQAKLEGLTRQIEEIIESLDEAVHDAALSAYAETLSAKVLLAWAMTDGGQPVPISPEVLKTRPLLFLQDLFAFCRERSLPREKKARMTLATTALVTPNGSSTQTSPQPTAPAT